MDNSFLKDADAEVPEQWGQLLNGINVGAFHPR